jgi:hypothetical protein
MRFTKLLDFFDFPARPHFERSLGSSAQNIVYCTKSDTRIAGPWSFGSPRQQGHRTDIEGFRDAIISGKSLSDLISDHPRELAKYDRFYHTVRNELYYKREVKLFKKGLKPRVIVLWSANPGSGKTRFVYDHHEAEGIYKVEFGTGSKGSLWFDNYNGEEVFLLDDFYGNCRYDFLLRFLDRYPIRCQSKGGSSSPVRRIVYITSNCPPEMWYARLPIGPDALLRRIDYTYCFDDLNGIVRPDESICELTDVEWSDSDS